MVTMHCMLQHHVLIYAEVYSSERQFWAKQNPSEISFPNSNLFLSDLDANSNSRHAIQATSPLRLHPARQVQIGPNVSWHRGAQQPNKQNQGKHA